ncbi:MAG TPA: hypothetical protein VN519_06765 [Bryobacteraceae bacterium]|nr:hypothetical protein [Bryobacteraceae bacterium]
MFETKETVKGYCIIVWYKTGDDTPIPLMVDGKLVVCDHLVIAQDICSVLCGDDRWMIAQGDDKAFYMPIMPDRISRAEIYQPYDPYNVPVGFFPGIHSEMKHDPKHTLWRYHISSWHAFFDAGQFRTRGGNIENLATGRQTPTIQDTTKVTVIPGVAESRTG